MSNLEFLRKNPIAHRGLFNKEEGIPENSIPAFQRAVENLYPIEIDVHLLEDGNLVIFHDDDLNRMTGVNKKIKDCTYEEIKNLKLNGTEYRIPLLTELLELVYGRVPILIELKYDRKTGETEKALMEIMKTYRGEYAVQSFNPKSLIWFKENFPEIPRGQLSGDLKNERMFILKKFILRNVLLNSLTKPDFVSYAIKGLPNRRIENFRKSGRLVLGWTVRDKDAYDKAKKYCDNIIGENFNKYMYKY